MPCYLFTYHAYLSWLPDRPQGYVRRREGILPPDEIKAKQYRQAAAESAVEFTARLQRILIDEVLRAAKFQEYRPHFAATDSTHLHVLLDWRTAKTWEALRESIKSSLSRRLNREIDRRSWFSENASRKRVKDRKHFDFLMTTYLPRHDGWKWSTVRGLFR